VRVGDWKLIHYPKVARTQLFDLKNDPAELKDLSADPRQAKRVEELLAVMRREQALYQDKVELTKSTPDGGAIGVEFFAGK
jgi:arylsulfatase A-like enzyme